MNRTSEDIHQAPLSTLKPISIEFLSLACQQLLLATVEVTEEADT